MAWTQITLQNSSRKERLFFQLNMVKLLFYRESFFCCPELREGQELDIENVALEREERAAVTVADRGPENRRGKRLFQFRSRFDVFFAVDQDFRPVRDLVSEADRAGFPVGYADLIAHEHFRTFVTAADPDDRFVFFVAQRTQIQAESMIVGRLRGFSDIKKVFAVPQNAQCLAARSLLHPERGLQPEISCRRQLGIGLVHDDALSGFFIADRKI